MYRFGLFSLLDRRQCQFVDKEGKTMAIVKKLKYYHVVDLIIILFCFFFEFSCSPWSTITVINKSPYSVNFKCKTIFNEPLENYRDSNRVLYSGIRKEKSNYTLGIYFPSESVEIPANKRLDILGANTTDIISELKSGPWESDKITDIINVIDNIFLELNIYSTDEKKLLADKEYFLNTNIIKIKYNYIPSSLIVELIFDLENTQEH
jgi:hypothetical protein